MVGSKIHVVFVVVRYLFSSAVLRSCCVRSLCICSAGCNIYELHSSAFLEKENKLQNLAVGSVVEF
jgi:hypothetical protein